MHPKLFRTGTEELPGGTRKAMAESVWAEEKRKGLQDASGPLQLQRAREFVLKVLGEQEGGAGGA